MATIANQRLFVARLPLESLCEELRAQWNALAGEIPFRRLEWLESWWRAYGLAPHNRDRELFTLAVVADGRLIGLAPWYREYSPTTGRAIRFLGAGEACSEYPGLLAAEGREGEVGAALADAITGRESAGHGAAIVDNGWDMLELKSARPGDIVNEAFLHRLEAKGCRVHRRAGPPCWRIELPPSWNDYLSRLSHSHRKQARRIVRRYFDTGRARVHSAADSSGLARGLALLKDLHQRRWQSRRESGCFTSPRFAAFIDHAAVRQLAAGNLSLHWLELDGSPIAAEYHLASPRSVYAYQSGIDPAALEHDPGRMITLALIRQAIDRRMETYDFLRGDEPYKSHFRATPSEVADVRVASVGATARLRDGLWLAHDNMKHWLKTGLGLAAAPCMTRSLS